jgi:molybdopterin biosynthesis enzyme MoaB
MNGSSLLTIRVLGLGEGGLQALPSVVNAVRELWAGVGSVEGLAIGDNPPLATRWIRRWCDRDRVDVVFTVGRGGHESTDYAPEMTAGLLTRELPGVEERMYLASPRRPLDLLFRGRAGLRKATLVVNLPDRAARARTIVGFLGPVVGHALEKARGSDRDCAAAGVRR